MHEKTDNENERQTTDKVEKERQEKEFNFDEWSRQHALSRKTTAALRQEELHQKDALVLLTPADIATLGLTLGQRKLLEAAVHGLGSTQLKQGASAPPVPMEHGTSDNGHQPSTEHIQAAGKRFDAFFSKTDLPKSLLKPESIEIDMNSHNVDVSEQLTKSNANWEFDPRALLTVKASTNKAVHITGFLSEKTKKRRQGRSRDLVITNNTSTDRLVIKSDEQHPYSGITVGEWGAANCRLMNHLIQTGKLARNDMEYYLAYTAKMFDFLDRYEWESILDYDYNYREMQAEHGFVWGTLSPHMELQLLVPRKLHNRDHQDGHQQHRVSKFNQRSSQPQQDCRLFLSRGHCPFGEKCKFRHPTINSTGHTTGPTNNVSKN